MTIREIVAAYDIRKAERLGGTMRELYANIWHVLPPLTEREFAQAVLDPKDFARIYGPRRFWHV